MIESTSTTRGFTLWRAVVIGIVAVLAIAMGAVAAMFITSARSIGAGPAAAYVPAGAPMYFEWRVIPSAEQEAALRGLLAQFPIPDFDADRPITDQWTELLDRALADSDAPFSWSEDVASWFDGRIAFALTDASVLSATSPDMAMQGFVFLVGVTDPAAAEAFTNDMREQAGIAYDSVDHGGVTIWSSSDGFGQTWAFAVADDQIVVAASADEVADALDVANGGDSFAANQELGALGAGLPDDWLGFGLVDNEAILASAREDIELTVPEMAPLFDELMAMQSTRGMMAVVATESGISFEGTADAPTGAFAVANEARDLATQVPSDALFFADGGNIGPVLAELATTLKAAAAAEPTAEEGIGQVEAALGAELEEVVEWIDDGAIAIGYDGSEPYGGLILTASDPEAATQRIESLLSLARLSVMDPSLGISVTETTIADTEVTTIAWTNPDVGLGMVPVTGAVLQVAVDGDRVLIGIGEAFVPRVLELDPADSLASSERFSAAIDGLGGTTNGGTYWWDVRGTRGAVEGAIPDMLSLMGDYETMIKPWLTPFDYVAGVSVADGDRVLQHGLFAINGDGG